TFVMVLIVLKVSALLVRLLGIARAIEGAALVYTCLGIGMIVVPLVLLGVNGVSWLLPPLRRANLRAFEETGMSYAVANAGLVRALAVTTPLGLLIIGIGVVEPWRGWP